MPQRSLHRIRHGIVILLAGCVLVHANSDEGVAQSSGAKKRAAPAITTQSTPNVNALPAAVVEMRDGILEAVRSGRIEDLAVPIAWNELPPTFARDKPADPISHLKSLSADGEGREILAILADLFDAGHAVLPLGRDVENNRLFVWPRFAEMPLDTLTPADHVQLYRLITPAMLKAMRERKRWTWWRLAIGADGTWHSFQMAE